MSHPGLHHTTRKLRIVLGSLIQSLSGAEQVYSMALPRVRLEHCNAGDNPTCWCCFISLTQPLHLLAISQARVHLRVPKTCVEENFHKLYGGEQLDNHLLRGPVGLKYQWRNRMSNLVVAVICVDHADPRGKPILYVDPVVLCPGGKISLLPSSKP